MKKEFSITKFEKSEDRYAMQAVKRAYKDAVKEVKKGIASKSTHNFVQNFRGLF